ncbi:MAG: hypothetical protein IT455_22440 [Planctomycetes bacterium]|nr:hypothetical protein [Planctomycetota bacterium]
MALLRRMTRMKVVARVLATMLAVLPAAQAVAQGDRASLPPRAADRAASPAASAAAAASSAKGLATNGRRVVEDDNVRIEETWSRGQLRRVVVTPKGGGRPYEIVPGAGGRDPSQDKSGAGQRVWSLFSF